MIVSHYHLAFHFYYNIIFIIYQPPIHLPPKEVGVFLVMLDKEKLLGGDIE